MLWKLEVKVEKATSVGFVEAIKKISSPVSCLFFINIFQYACLNGIYQYYQVFAQENLGASSQWIGMYFQHHLREKLQLPLFSGITTGMSVGGGIIVSPFAQTIVDKVKSFNLIFISSIVFGVRLIIASLWKSEYQMFVLCWFDIVNYTLYWVACVTYAYKMAPPKYLATVMSINGALQWMIGKD